MAQARHRLLRLQHAMVLGWGGFARHQLPQQGLHRLDRHVRLIRAVFLSDEVPDKVDRVADHSGAGKSVEVAVATLDEERQDEEAGGLDSSDRKAEFAHPFGCVPLQHEQVFRPMHEFAQHNHRDRPGQVEDGDRSG